MKTFLLSLLSSVMAFAPGADPASSWLAYVRINLGNEQITNISMSWVCPAAPPAGTAPALPGFWYGIENSQGKFPEMTVLLQPIMAIGYNVGPSDYTLFNGRYDWNDGSWWSSPKQCDVSPGQTVTSYTAYNSQKDQFDLVITNANTGCTVSNSLPAGGLTYGNAIIVIEHQPSNCDQMPGGGGMTFEDIQVQVGGKTITPQWQGAKFQDVCDVTPIVSSPSTVQFTWEDSSKTTST